MMVFGDVQFSETLQNFMRQIRERASNARPDSLDDLRALLIQCGQLEQAVSDSDFGGGQWQTDFQEITDTAARAFLTAYAEEKHPATSVDQELVALCERLSDAVPFDSELAIKVPEGYEFYALYPEQYRDSATRWLLEHPSAKSAIVVGIRSIGTSLSATVGAVLKEGGIKTKRTTVRPNGNPFQREVAKEAFHVKDTEFALIVDEGPGISGSSMTAAAEALVNAGMKRETNSFFPGHTNPPGAAASAQVQSWWNSTPRYFTPLSRVHWYGKSLETILSEKSSELCGCDCSAIDDLSAGTWRKFAFTNERDWPAANIPFERAKFLCTARNGKRILWKFYGLGSLYSDGKTFVERSRTLFRLHAPPLLAELIGFVASPWIEGTRFSRENPDEVLNPLARHIVESRGEILRPEQIDRGIRRLDEMLHGNLEKLRLVKNEICIAALAERARRFFRENPQSVCASKYGDGHLAPHEWVRTKEGKIFKADFVGHDTDHTLIGEQSMLWDVAGAVIEWDFCETTTEAFLRRLESVGVEADSVALEFFLLSYAGFGMGQSFMCADILGCGHSEYSRLRHAGEFYEGKIHEMLNRRHHSAESLARHNR